MTTLSPADQMIDESSIRAKVNELLAALGPSLETLPREEIEGILLPLKVEPEVIAAAVVFAAGDTPEQDSQTPQLDAVVMSLVHETHKMMQAEAQWRQTSELEEGHHMMMLSMLEDARVVFIILACHLWRLRHIKDAADDVKREAALESRQFYAPLANRLGLGQLKWEMEDLAFRYLDPVDYQRIAKALEERRVDRENYIEKVVTALRDALQAAGISAQVYGRPKHIYSIWRKMNLKQLNFEQLFDVRALRVMVDTMADCYASLSVVHSLWPYIESEYDDYISAPKGNMYQSLHTAVVGPEGKTLEIQIRTQAMHEHAELGVAAHWRYKEGGKRDEAVERRIELLRRVLDGSSDISRLSSVESDASKVYVLTPQGKVVELSVGATPLDFAYAIHTDIGHRCRGAKVDGQMVSLTTELKSGQRVEVLTAKQAEPSRDWLSRHSGYLKTSRARSKVRQWFKQQFRQEHMQQGRANLEKEMGRQDIHHVDMTALALHFNLSEADDLYAAVGRGELGVNQVLNAARDQIAPLPQETDELPHKVIPTRRVTRGIAIEGVGDLLTNIAGCCKPVPGDDIIGFITHGRGVTIHRQSCVNVNHWRQASPERLVDVSWGEAGGRYEVDVEVEAMDRAGLLRDVSSVLAAAEVNVLAANTHTNRKTFNAHMRITVEINSNEQLESALVRLLQINGVFDARRIR